MRPPGQVQSAGTLGYAAPGVYLRCKYTLLIDGIRFEWDERKNRANQRKHRISFEEAETVFYDDWAILVADDDPNEPEDRFVMLGMSAGANTLVVCHCYREVDSVIRIISARRANKSERADYRSRWEK